MKPPRVDRMLVGLSVFRRTTGPGQGTTAGGWRDKRAHIALRSGDCSDWGFPAHAHLASHQGNVRRNLSPLIFRHYQHIAGSSHDR